MELHQEGSAPAASAAGFFFAHLLNNVGKLRSQCFPCIDKSQLPEIAFVSSREFIAGHNVSLSMYTACTMNIAHLAFLKTVDGKSVENANFQS